MEEKRDIGLYIRITPTERERLNKIIEKERKKTGYNISESDYIRKKILTEDEKD